MKAWRIERICSLKDETQPLVRREVETPRPGQDEVLIKVSTCGVCHTELDEIEGRTPPPRLPVTPGHEVVGRVIEGGSNLGAGTRVGVAWIFSACGRCRWCREGRENLCPQFLATGRDADGGYAEYMTAPEGFVYPIPEALADVEAAPLLCAGAVGYRSLRLAGIEDGQVLGLTGFGASGHLVLKMAGHLYPRSQIFVFARSPEQRELALALGAAWAGDTGQRPPEPPRAIIDTTPVWRPALEALSIIEPGGRLVINAIRKEDSDRELLSRLDYAGQLWQEKQIQSVANVTGQDVRDFLRLADSAGIRPEVETYPFSDANRALLDLASGSIRGAKVLVI